ncbi:receptor-transporting protein 3-like [Discoglossus pictus]
MNGQKMDEAVWRRAFDSEIEELGVHDEWNFSMDRNLQQQQRDWLQYTQCTFARFTCSHCGRWWNSAEVHVLFFFKLDRQMSCGTVKMRIFRQECKRCNSAVMENPEISHENIKRVLSNMVKRIQSKFYRQDSEHQDMKSVIYSNKMEGPHDQAHCEACKQKVCQWQMLNNEPKKANDQQEPSADATWQRPPLIIPLPPPPQVIPLPLPVQLPKVIPLPPPPQPPKVIPLPPPPQLPKVIPLPPPPPQTPTMIPLSPPFQLPKVIPLPPPPQPPKVIPLPPPPQLSQVIPSPPPTEPSHATTLCPPPHSTPAQQEHRISECVSALAVETEGLHI